MRRFKASLNIIGINPFVFVPEQILKVIFAASNRNKGPIPVSGKINGNPFTQTLLRYRGHWRLYVNTTMLPDSPKRIGEVLEVAIQYDGGDRSIAPHPQLVKALRGNREAKRVFDALAPSKQKEIVRYLSYLKTDESVNRNVERAIGFLLGKNSFVGRQKP